MLFSNHPLLKALQYGKYIKHWWLKKVSIILPIVPERKLGFYAIWISSSKESNWLPCSFSWKSMDIHLRTRCKSVEAWKHVHLRICASYNQVGESGTLAVMSLSLILGGLLYATKGGKGNPSAKYGSWRFWFTLGFLRRRNRIILIHILTFTLLIYKTS